MIMQMHVIAIMAGDATLLYSPTPCPLGDRMDGFLGLGVFLSMRSESEA